MGKFIRILGFLFFGLLATTATAQPFKIEVVRSRLEQMEGRFPDGTIVSKAAVIGDLGLNGVNMGRTVENADLRIPAGTYRGLLRYVSQKGFVVGPWGTLGNTGDFLIEIADVPPERSGILFHGGNKPWHSTGCILLGAVSKSKDGKFLPDDHPMRALRKVFYGSETPNQTPNKPITIIIYDIK